MIPWAHCPLESSRFPGFREDPIRHLCDSAAGALRASLGSADSEPTQKSRRPRAGSHASPSSIQAICLCDGSAFNIVSPHSLEPRATFSWARPQQLSSTQAKLPIGKPGHKPTILQDVSSQCGNFIIQQLQGPSADVAAAYPGPVPPARPIINRNWTMS